MFTQRRLMAAACAVLGLILIVSAVGVARADAPLGFAPIYRFLARTSSAYIGDNKAFSDKKLNPAGADLTGFLTIYADPKALPNFLTGKKQPFAEGAVIMAELTEASTVPGTKIALEKAGVPKMTLWMIKDSTQSKEQGGWRWELWTVKDGKDVNANLDAKTQVAACVFCHTKMFGGIALKSDLVFDNFTDTAHIADYQATLAKMLGENPSATMAATAAQ